MSNPFTPVKNEYGVYTTPTISRSAATVSTVDPIANFNTVNPITTAMDPMTPVQPDQSAQPKSATAFKFGPFVGEMGNASNALVKTPPSNKAVQFAEADKSNKSNKSTDSPLGLAGPAFTGAKGDQYEDAAGGVYDPGSPLSGKQDKGKGRMREEGQQPGPSTVSDAIDSQQASTTTSAPPTLADSDPSAGSSSSAGPVAPPDAAPDAPPEQQPVDEYQPPFARPENNEPAPQPGEVRTRAIAMEELYMYDIDVISVRPLSQHEQTEVRRVFKEQVGMNDQQKHRLVHVNGNVVLTARSIAPFQSRFYVHVCAPAEHRGVDKPKPGPEWRPAYIGMSPEGRTERQWVKVGGLNNLPPTFLLAGDGTIIGNDNCAIDHETIIEDSLPDLRDQLGQDFTAMWNSTAVVFARETKVTIPALRIMDCWSTKQERSRLDQIQNMWATSQVLQQDAHKGASLIMGNKVYGQAQPLECGIEKREGKKLKFQLEPGKGKVITETLVNQHFLRPILVSDFMVDFYGSKGVNRNDPEVINELSNIFKGVQVTTSSSGLHTKPSVIKMFDSRAPDLIEIPARNTTTGTTTLSARYEQELGRPLRHGDLPCVDVGTEGRTFYVPPEACLIQPNQPFKGAPLPLNKGDTSFTLRKAKKFDAAKDRAAKAKPNPFENITAHGFDIVFAEVIVMPEGAALAELSADRPISAGDWSKFRQSIGQRYGGKLEAVVRRSANIKLPYRPGINPVEAWCNLILDAIREAEKGAKAVLIVAIPDVSNFQDIYRHARRICDLNLGIQCNVIKAGTLNACFKSDQPDALKHYTAQLVRKTFARALIPGAVDPDYETSIDYDQKFAERSKKLGPDDHGLLIAIDVKRLAGSDRRCADSVYLVTIASHARWHYRDNFKTSHSIASTEYGSSLPQKIEQCVKKHLGITGDKATNRRNELLTATHIVYYHSGAEAENRKLITEEVNFLQYNTDAKTTFPHLRFREHITYVKDPTFTVAGAEPEPQNDVNCLVREIQSTVFRHGTHEMESWKCRDTKVLSEIEVAVTEGNMANPFGLDVALQEVYVRGFSDTKQSRKTYLVTHCHRATEMPQRAALLTKNAVQENTHLVSAFKDHSETRNPGEQHAFLFYSLLKDASLPDILFLADEAAKRMLMYIEDGHGSDVGGRHTRYELPEIHENLRHSLYFL